MNATVRSHAPLPLLLLGTLLGLGSLAGCGKSGGGGSSFALINTSFGRNPFTGGLGSGGNVGQAPVINMNGSVFFQFSDSVDPRSVSTESVIVQEINTNTNPPTPKGDAAVTFRVQSDKLIVSPLLTFSDTNVSFGFKKNSTYQVIFQVPPSSPVVRSRSGVSVRAQDQGPFIFRTNSTIFDNTPGPPQPSITLRSPQSGADLGTTSVPNKPVPDLEIDFNEPVIPTTILADPSTGRSDSLRVQLDTDGDINTALDRLVIPGRFALAQTQTSAQVTWTSFLKEIPTGPAGLLYVVTVDGTVTDLAGTSKVSAQKDPAAKDEFPFTTAPGAGSGPADPVVEEFLVRANEAAVSSARWGTGVPGFLTPGIGGGTGVDGNLDPLDPNFPLPHLLAQISVDGIGKIITIQTEDQGLPGTPFRYEFLRINVPIGWTLQPAGPFPWEVLVAGDVDVGGVVDLSGEDADQFPEAQVAGGQPGTGQLGGASGGTGGAAADDAGASTLFPAGGSPDEADLGFQAPLVAEQGVSGRISAVTDFTVTDTTLNLELAVVLPDPSLVDLWIQPNVGADDWRFERHHPAFHVESFSGPIGNQVITVTSDPTDPNYRGSMQAETTNPTLEDDGAGGFRPPLLAEPGDAYLIGTLGGAGGGALFDSDLDGAVDDRVSFQGGAASEAQAVAQTYQTLGRSGGGGGGGGVFAGGDGQDDPTVGAGPGLFGGTGGVGGPGGAQTPSSSVAVVLSSTQLRLQAPVFDDGAGSPDPMFVGHLINPNVGQGQTFSILVVTAVDTCVIEPILTLDGTVLDLSTVPGLIPGVLARVSPPYTVGGSGGGGAGVHCAGSGKDPKGQQGYPMDDPRRKDGFSDPDFYDDADDDFLEDDAETIFEAPVWVPGGGGGAGGGVARFLVGGQVRIRSSGIILADGGDGGGSTGSAVNAASGGGGGAGGTLFLGVGDDVQINSGGMISAMGGQGGGQGVSNGGGNGAPGRIRIEDATGSHVPSDFSGATLPAITAENLGVFPGGGNSLGQSVFLAGGTLVPDYQRIVITYDYRSAGGQLVTGARYIVQRDGTVDPASNLTTPPFQLSLNFTDSDPNSGLPVNPPLDPTFYDPTANPLSNFTGMAYVRFRVVLDDPSNPIYPQSSVQIDSVVIDVNGITP